MTDNTRPMRAGSRLERVLRAGLFAVTAELNPPDTADPHAVYEAALVLAEVADGINATDASGANAHMSSLGVCALLIRAGYEAVLQMSCRDRNRIALQGDLLGAAAFGIHNILVLAGDNPAAGDQPQAKPVYDMDSRGLIAMADRMRNEHKLPTGVPIEGKLKLVIGAADVPVDPPADWSPKGLFAKAEAGADFVQTQFCMDTGIVRRYAARLRELGFKLPILVGVAPIPSARSARWMREKLFGTIVPEAIVERLEKAADPKAEGRRICVEVLQELAEIPGVAGAHVMAPMNFAEIPRAIEESGVLNKKRKAA